MVLADIRKLYEDKKDLDAVEKELLNYYSTAEGKAELRNSPNGHLSTKEAVELLMQDVRTWARKGLK